MATNLNVNAIIDGSIAKAKLAADVQTSLGKANTAIQSLSLEVLPTPFGDITDILPNFHYITDFTSITSETPASGVNLTDAVSGKENNYIWVFHTGAVAPTIIWPADWQWISSAPTINANKVYEVRICDNGLDKLAVACEYSTPSNE